MDWLHIADKRTMLVLIEFQDTKMSNKKSMETNRGYRLPLAAEQEFGRAFAAPWLFSAAVAHVVRHGPPRGSRSSWTGLAFLEYDPGLI
jgi:hypothetical protein